MMVPRHRMAQVVLLSAAALISRGTPSPDDARRLHESGIAAHVETRLNDASALYDEALRQEPPQPPSPSQAAAVRRFAPRLFTTASEPFALENAAAIVHPSRPLIAYHLFWDDDIDFPDDNEPTDHEVVWMQYSGDGTRLERLWAYFHGRLLESRGGPTDARPRIDVQWGKHGSLPERWHTLEIGPEQPEGGDGIRSSPHGIPLLAYLQDEHRKLSTTGRRLPDPSPRAAARLAAALRGHAGIIRHLLS